MQGSQDGHPGLLSVQHAAQVAHVFDAGLAAFDLNDGLLRPARLRDGAEETLPVNAVVHVFFQLDGPCAHQVQGPPLKLLVVRLGQDVRLVERDRFADGMISLLSP